MIIARNVSGDPSNAIKVSEAYDRHGIRLAAIIVPRPGMMYAWVVIGQADAIDYEAVDRTINELIGPQ